MQYVSFDHALDDYIPEVTRIITEESALEFKRLRDLIKRMKPVVEEIAILPYHIPPALVKQARAIMEELKKEGGK